MITVETGHVTTIWKKLRTTEICFLIYESSTDIAKTTSHQHTDLFTCLACRKTKEKLMLRITAPGRWKLLRFRALYLQWHENQTLNWNKPWEKLHLKFVKCKAVIITRLYLHLRHANGRFKLLKILEWTVFLLNVLRSNKGNYCNCFGICFVVGWLLKLGLYLRLSYQFL